MDKSYLWEILVPTVKSFDPPKYYSTRYHRIWDQKVMSISGGLTIHRPSKGQWISKEGELFEERMIPVKIMCSREQIEQIADFTATYYNQKAIMFYLISTESYIKHYQKE